MERMARGMAGSMVHRGPDDEGVWVDAEAGIALGHRRLSIVDLSPEGHQPMRSHCGRHVISFNGEVYNHKDLRRKLEALGRRFGGHSDTEVILAAIAEWGVDAAVGEFNGMFAIALWDRQEKTLHLIRDRAGEKPLYYGWLGETLVFGSELKALRAHPGFACEIDRNALASFVRSGYIPAPHSIYRGIFKLPAGASLTVSPAQPRPEPKPYWTARQAAERGISDPFRGTELEAASELDSLMSDAVRLRMEADVPLGAFLSGGIDSSLVVALMQAHSPRPVRTFTIGFHECGYNEAQQSKLVAKHLGTEHTELYITPAQALSVIPKLPAIYDEPFADSSQVPALLVSEMARRHVTVALSGDGGDELFSGYTHYFRSKGISAFAAALPRPAKLALARAMQAVPARTWDTLFGAIEPLLPRSARLGHPGHKLHELSRVIRANTPGEIYVSLISRWKDPASIVIGSSEPATVLNDPGQWISSGDFVQRMMYADTAAYLPDDILVKMDRASMSESLEVRAPLLDHRLIEFAWRIPQSMKIRDGKGKWLMRRVLDKYAPKGLIERPKKGFAVPIDEWLRGPLRGWAEELLDERRLRSEGFFHPRPIREKWAEHIAGVRNWQHSIWNILMFQAWLDETRKNHPEDFCDTVPDLRQSVKCSHQNHPLSAC
jgi:asparagine synthase (glutamine-hydrolysing)